MGKTLTFLSTSKRNMNVDLMALKTDLQTRKKDIEFQYYIKPVNNPNRYIRLNMYAARKHVIKEYAEDIVCMDLSLPGDIASYSKGKKILLSAPFDYQFKDYHESITEKDFKKKEAMKGFTHIIPGSPFGKKLLETVYDVEGVEILDGICLPLAVDLNNQEKSAEIRKKMERIYPTAKGKKIAALVLDGYSAKKPSGKFKKFDLKKLLDTYGEEWFFITTNQEVINQAFSLSFEYHKCIGVLHEMMLKSDLLYLADLMITNISRYVTAFASKKKPVYYMEYGKYYCGKYIKEHYPEFYLGKADDIFKIPFDVEKIQKSQADFYKEFSYDADEKVFEVISDCLQ